MEIAGGQYLMSDVMLPHGETLIREVLKGKRYIRDKFDQDVIVGWGADEFGFNAQWPQILLGCGYKYFAFRRGADQCKPSEFWWEGLDGSRILSHWMPLGYRAGLDLTQLRKSYKELENLSATRHIFMPSGSGVTLPQPETVYTVRNWNARPVVLFIYLFIHSYFRLECKFHQSFFCLPTFVDLFCYLHND
jgi:alpha-mannosidase